MVEITHAPSGWKILFGHPWVATKSLPAIISPFFLIATRHAKILTSQRKRALTIYLNPSSSLFFLLPKLMYAQMLQFR
jgi:hypothetical protein